MTRKSMDGVDVECQVEFVMESEGVWKMKLKSSPIFIRNLIDFNVQFKKYLGTRFKVIYQ